MPLEGTMTKILLIDDHPDIRRLIRITLGKAYDVYEAENGVTGFELARSMEPDLAVLDMMMPGGVDGLQVLEAIKAEPSLAHTRVIMVSARGPEHREICLRQGAEAYFTKPFSPLELVAFIKQSVSMNSVSKAFTAAPRSVLAHECQQE
jgi:CheY-like chemotaxis protein